MNSLWLENKVLSFLTDAPVPKPGQGEALVKVRLAGICSTDLELVRGYYPFTGIPGHEFVGEVTEAPDDPTWVGKRVVGEINIACGICDTCRRGLPTHCERRNVLGIIQHPGVFAEYLTLPTANLHPVPDSIPDEAAVFVEPLAAALEIQEQVHISPSDRVLIVGAGRLGQLVAQILQLTGCHLQVLARHESQRKILSDRRIPVIREEQIPEGKIDMVVDASGSPGGFEIARRAAAPRGKIVLKSTYAGEMQVNLSSIVVDEVTLIGSRCGPFPPALRLLAQNQVDPRPLIAARVTLSEGIAAFEKAGKPGALKILLQP